LAGASAVLVEQPVEVPARVSVLLVRSTLEALGALARAYRNRWQGTLVAVAGSAGKTTTKTAIAELFETLAPGAVLSTPGNLNNAIGVPLVLLCLSEKHRFAVVEIGTNQPGEVLALTRMAGPNLGVLTLIGLEHSEGLVDLDGVEAEEGAMLSAIISGGAIVFNGDDERVSRQVARAAHLGKLSYGFGEGLCYRVVERNTSASGASELVLSRPDKSRLVAKSRLLGEAGGYAALAALAVAERALGTPVSGETLSRALQSDRVAAAGRLFPVELADGSLLIDDSYNSNPASLESSLAVARELADLRGAGRFLVLGEMRELGELSRSEHERMGRGLGRAGARALIALGGDARFFVEACPEAGPPAAFADDAGAAVSLVLDRVEQGDVILVKASRGVGAERVVEGLIEAKGRAA
jgi:UDP-N-acetylmuramoyl-tripeptide--D-alanyl-D-alanine ligase